MMEKQKQKKNNISFLLSYFKFYGNTFPIYYQKHSKYSSKLGLILGIITIIIIISLFIHDIILMLNRSNFNIIISEKNKINQTMNFSEIPFMIKLFSQNKNDLEVNVYKKKYNISNNKILINSYPIKIESCENSLFIKKYPEMDKFPLNDYLCLTPNQNLSIFGKYNDLNNNFETLSIILNINNNNIFFNNTFISVVFINYLIDHFDYKNPIFYQFKSKDIKIENEIYKKFIFYFSSLIYENDVGFFFNKNINYKFYSYKKSSIEFIKNSLNDNYNNNSLIEIEFSCFNQEIKYTRKSIKFDEFFSKLGGFIYFLSFIFQNITIYFSSKSLIVKIINSIIYQNISRVEVKRDIRKLSKCVNLNNLNRNVLNNSTHNLLLFKRFSVNVTNDKNYNNSRNLFNSLNTLNYRRNSYLKSKAKMEKKKLSISFIYYFIPFSCLKHYKKYDFIVMYNDILTSFLSIEKILPVIERGYKFFYDKGNDSSFQKISHNIFKIKKDENLTFSDFSRRPFTNNDSFIK